MTDTKKPAAKAKKIIDVAHPDQSAPSPNSKSVIITHHPAIQDPMMVAAGDNTKANDVSEEHSEVASPSKHTVLQPLSTSPTATQQAKPDAEQSAEMLLPLPAAITEQAAVNDELSPEAVAPDEANVVTPEPFTEETDEVANKSDGAIAQTVPADESKKPATEQAAETSIPSSTGSDAKLGTKDIQTEAELAAEADEQEKRQAELQAMIDSRRFYLPINSRERRRTKQFVIGGVLLGIVLAVVWVEIALDAGLIELGGLQPITHFFN
ncbi:MAG: hypothetical protein ABIV43_01915 [Candidatus Saccharimonadales bacterium]